MTNLVDAVLDASPLTYATVGAGLFMAVVWYKLLFKDFADFVGCLRFLVRPNVVSLFKGEEDEDRWGEFKLFVWLGLSVFCGVMSQGLLVDWFPGLVGK